jgi:hypothetical protein
MMIKNNNNIKHSSAFILNTFQTHFSMFNTSWATTLGERKEKEKKTTWVLDRWLVKWDSNKRDNAKTTRRMNGVRYARRVKITERKYIRGSNRTPGHNCVTVIRIKAPVCTLEGHRLQWNYVGEPHFRIHGLRDADVRVRPVLPIRHYR